MIEETPLTREKEQLARILASSSFKSSRQMSDFLRYISERTLAGEPVEQSEIAREVLGRPDFDPISDASVRKLASQIRQRLERYYEKEGCDDPVIVSLPVRTYSPNFSLRQSAPDTSPVRGSRKRTAIFIGLITVFLAIIVIYLWPQAPTGDIRIQTRKGDIRPVADPAADAIRFGAPVGEGEEIRTQLIFRPAREGQFAGVLAWQSATQWLAFGRRFTSSNVLTFGYQDSATYRVIAEVPDTEGQSGEPVFLRLVRKNSEWSAWWGVDQENWHLLGAVQHPGLKAPRSAIFALNGRRDSPSIEARFHLPGKGVTSPQVGLCELPPDACQDKWSRPVPAGEWSITTRMDMASHPSVAAGLFVTGTSGRLRLVRYRSDSTLIALIQDGRMLESVPDFPGSPPVFLRLTSRGGKMTAECSTDGIDFRQVGHAIDLTSLGTLREYGALSSRRLEADASSVPTPHFFFVQQDLM